MQLPKARITQIIEQETNNELLVYDLQTNKAFTLNETSKNIFKACNGEISFDDLKRQYKYTDDIIYLALDELKKNNLMEDDDYSSPFSGMNRREVIRKVGLSTMIALPVILSLTAPSAAAAASPGAIACSTPNSQCYCQNGDSNSCGTGRVIFAGAQTCPSDCTCFTPGTCSTAGIGCSGTCG